MKLHHHERRALSNLFDALFFPALMFLAWVLLAAEYSTR